LDKLYRSAANLFGHKCVILIFELSIVSKMIDSDFYECAKKWRLRTERPIFERSGFFKMPVLLRVKRILGKLSPGKFYLINLAVYLQ